MKTKNLFFLVACLIFSLNVNAQDNYLRVTDLSQVQNGSTVIFAARHDSLSLTSYYAMSNEASGKPLGVAFMATESDNGMMLPQEVLDKEVDYSWVVGITDANYTFINPDGDMIGYGNSGTDFVKNGANSTWSIVADTSGKATSVPNHSAYIITNVGAPNRSIAFRKYNNGELYEKFAPYSNTESNMSGDNYFFYIDIFVKASEVIPVVSLPKFNPEGGDYIETQNVTISCDTEDAMIYYTLDGKNPTDTSMVYTTPIKVTSTTTIKAFAKKEGMLNSGVVTTKYNIIEPVDISFYSNGTLVETKTYPKGQSLGELPVPAVPNGYCFSGWTDDEITGSLKELPDVVTPTTIAEEDMDVYALFSVSNNNCNEIDVPSLTSSDAVVIAVSKDDKYYAMSQIKGSNGQPTAYEIVVANGKILNAIPDDIKWNIASDNGNMIIYPDGDKENWLYCTSGSSNNSVRIGTNTDNNIFELKTIEINDVVYTDYMYNKTTERFVGVYNDDDVMDWRAYKLTTSGAFPSNIKGQTYHFFRSEGYDIYCTNVEIPETQTITTNTTWDNVSIINKIIIEKDVILTIKGAISCTDAQNIVIKDGGQLVHNNVGVNATLEKEVKGYGATNEGWYTIASPLMGNTDISDVDGLLADDYDLYRYNEQNCVWQNVKDNSNDFNCLEQGRGYLYANKYDATLSFSGELNSNAVSYYMTKTGDDELSGFHLIGNPFAHDIYKGRGAAIDDENLADGYYTLSNSGVWGARVSGDNPISPCQSILVKTTKEGVMDIKKINAKPSDYDNKPLFSISASNDYYEDVVHVMLNDGTGLEKINHRNDDAQMIYIPIDDVNYAVAVVDDNEREIPISFVAKTMGEYTISVTVDNEEYDYVYLVDNYTGDIIDMLVDDYIFLSTTGDNAERFVLKLYDIYSIEECQTETVFAFVNNNELIINDVAGEARIQIYDILGRPMVNIDRCDDGKIVLPLGNFETGVYVVRKIDDGGVVTQRFVVR